MRWRIECSGETPVGLGSDTLSDQTWHPPLYDRREYSNASGTYVFNPSGKTCTVTATVKAETARTGQEISGTDTVSLLLEPTLTIGVIDGSNATLTDYLSTFLGSQRGIISFSNDDIGFDKSANDWISNPNVLNTSDIAILLHSYNIVDAALPQAGSDALVSFLSRSNPGCLVVPGSSLVNVARKGSTQLRNQMPVDLPTTSNPYSCQDLLTSSTNTLSYIRRHYCPVNDSLAGGN